MLAYYNDKFIDRNGSIYSKPKLGLTITNGTITAAIAITLEALFDLIQIDRSNIKAPIIFEATTLNEPSGITATTWMTHKGQFNTTGTYAYVVTAKNNQGETSQSMEVNADVTLTTDTVVLSWNAIVGATGYNLYRTATPGTYTSSALLASTTATSYQDIGKTTSMGSPPRDNTATNNVAWITKEGKTPTLVSIATKFKIFDPTNPQDVPYLIMKAVYLEWMRNVCVLHGC